MITLHLISLLVNISEQILGGKKEINWPSNGLLTVNLLNRDNQGIANLRAGLWLRPRQGSFPWFVVQHRGNVGPEKPDGFVLLP